MPTAEIVAIGTELLLGDIADTNSQLLAKAFAEHGIAHTRRTVVGDNLQRATLAIQEALARADIVVTIAGLGPTPDDLTREAIAAAIGEDLVVDQDTELALRKYMEERGRPWMDSVGRQAQRPRTSHHLPNTVGTAPGVFWQGGGKTIIALPGPRSEFQAMLNGSVISHFKALSSSVIHSKTLRIAGMPEATVAELVADLLQGENPTVAPYAKPGEVHVRITASASDVGAAQRLIAPVAAAIRQRLGAAVYGEDDCDLAATVLALLRTNQKKLVTAESCTGGMLGQRITSVPGSSESYVGGFITYSNEMKARELGVARTDLNRFGAVSEAVARQMAEGACRVTGAEYGIGITGIAGPDGGSPEKPVGLVYISVAGTDGTEVREERFAGNREDVRYRSTQVALDLLRKRLMR
jgi:nicotinamide-nucleotide amidase